MRPPHKCSRQGFTLTELAIVLGVIGVMLGAVWSASTMVYQNMKINQTQRQILTVVSNIRALYPAGKAFANGSVQQNITSALVAAGVFPNEMLSTTTTGNVNTTTPMTVWGAPMIVYSSTSNPLAASAQEFEIQIIPMPQKAMCALLGLLAGGADSEALDYLYDDNGWHAVAGGNLDVTSFSCTAGNFSSDWELKVN